MENKVISIEYVNKNFIDKYKIRDKIIEIKNKKVEDMFITSTQAKLDTIIVLESLLEESGVEI